MSASDSESVCSLFDEGEGSMFGRLVVLLKKHRPRKTKDSARTQSGSRFADLLKRQVPAVIRSLPTQQRTTAPPTLGDAKVQGTCSNARVPRFSCRCRNNGRTFLRWPFLRNEAKRSGSVSFVRVFPNCAPLCTQNNLAEAVAVSIMHLVVLDLDHASRCSGPRSLSLAACLGIIQSSIAAMFLESAGFTQVLVVGAAAGCLTSSSVCLSRPARLSHGSP